MISHLAHFAQTADYNSGLSSGADIALGIAICIVFIAVVVANWKIFEKAGYAGWKALIPVYNNYILLKIVGMSGWYLILLIIPYVGIVALIPVYYKLSKCFGYGVGMTVLAFLFVGQLILGFGDAKYTAPVSKTNNKQIEDTPYPKTKTA